MCKLVQGAGHAVGQVWIRSSRPEFETQNAEHQLFHVTDSQPIGIRLLSY